MFVNARSCFRGLSRSQSRFSTFVESARRNFRPASTFAGAASMFSSPLEITDIMQYENRLSIRWADGECGDFHFSWLKDNNPLSFSSSGQKLPISIIPGCESLIPKDMETRNNDTELWVRWEDQRDYSSFDSQWLRMHLHNMYHLREKSAQLEAINNKSRLVELEYDSLFASKSGCYKWLKAMNDNGLCLVKNVPCNDGEVLKVSGLVGKPSHTIYGETFDVIAVPNPINIAYTDKALEFHNDLVYFESPPGLQYLHALQYDESIEGGNSTFIDGHAVAEIFRERFPKEFNVLKTVPATFQKNHVDRDDPVRLFYQRPHISVNYNDEVNGVFWAPPFEGPLQIPSEEVDAYYSAYAEFRKLMNSEEMMEQYGHSFRLQTGDLICFNNRRMLHGREVFESHEGTRHLQGTYNDIDSFLNKYRVHAFELDPHPEDYVSGGLLAYGEQRVGTSSHT